MDERQRLGTGPGLQGHPLQVPAGRLRRQRSAVTPACRTSAPGPWGRSSDRALVGLMCVRKKGARPSCGDVPKVSPGTRLHLSHSTGTSFLHRPGWGAGAPLTSQGRAGDRCYRLAGAWLLPPPLPPDSKWPLVNCHSPLFLGLVLGLWVSACCGQGPHTAGNRGSEWAAHLSTVTQPQSSRGGLRGHGRRGTRSGGAGPCRAAEQETTGQELCGLAWLGAGD